MPLDLLSSITGATSSEAVEALFSVIKEAMPEEEGGGPPEEDHPSVSLDHLRSDTVEECPEGVKGIIRKNFPEEKNGFLVVPRVMEE